MRGKQNMVISRKNYNENMVVPYLKDCGVKYSRQSRWGYRIFDFWFHTKGIALEIDGFEHNTYLDSKRDEENLNISGILTLRVRNGDIEAIKKAVETIKTSELWSERRISLGLKPLKRDLKDGTVIINDLPLFSSANPTRNSRTNKAIGG